MALLHGTPSTSRCECLPICASQPLWNSLLHGRDGRGHGSRKRLRSRAGPVEIGCFTTYNDHGAYIEADEGMAKERQASALRKARTCC